MNLFDKIAIPVNLEHFPSRAVEMALETAMHCSSSEIHLVAVMDVSSLGYYAIPEVGLAVNLPTQGVYEAALDKKVDQVLQATSGRYTVKVKKAIFTGSYIERMDAYIKEHDINLVVMSAQYTGGVNELLFGSTAQRMASRMSCPVLTVHDDMKTELVRKIILPVENFYPEMKMAYAVQLASFYHAQIYLLYLRSHFNVLGSPVRQILTSICDELQFKLIPYRTIAVSGDNITDAILQYAEVEKAGIVLVNPGSEAKLTGKVFPSTGGNIVNHVSIPVLTVQRKLPQI